MTNIQRVAQLAGVSVATVSRMINNTGNVASKTREKVERAIADLDYVPNMLARNFRTSRSKSILVLLTSISNMFYMEIVHGISECANSNGYDILLGETDGFLDKQIKGLEKVKNHMADGAVILESTIHDDVLLSMEEKYPVIQCCSFNEEIDLPYIIVDNEKSGALAAEELIAAGCGKFAFVGTNDRSMYNRKRRGGFLKTLRDNNIGEENIFVMNSSLGFEGGRCAVRELGDRNVDGFFFVSDMQAVGAMREFFGKGVNIPRDVSIIGHDNLELCDVVIPPLTSISQPAREMGREAAKVLIGHIQGGEKIKGYRKVFRPELVRRGSVREKTYR